VVVPVFGGTQLAQRACTGCLTGCLLATKQTSGGGEGDVCSGVMTSTVSG